MIVKPLGFPYGLASFWILVLALVSGTAILAVSRRGASARPDLVLVLFARNHCEAYGEAVAEYEKRRGVRIGLQLVTEQALRSRLQAALQTGAEVPDLVEILNPTMGYFTRGPLADVGFMDLTDRLRGEGLYDRMVESRYSLWSSRGRVFAMPHDVHPVVLCYRRDLVESLGIDVGSLATWDDFAAMGRRVTADLNGDGIKDRYAIDLPSQGAYGLTILLLQKGISLFDREGRVNFERPETADVLCWYIRQTCGPDRISFDAGWGQNLAQTMSDGLVLFYFCPDWRTKQIAMDVPALKGKLALLPLPAWEKGGRRTSTWGGTGLAITRACGRQDLAWDFAKFLYLTREELGKRFVASNIIPPVKDAWSLPEFERPLEFFSGQKVGRLYADLAPSAPDDFVSPYTEMAGEKLDEAYLNAAARYRERGDAGLHGRVMEELRRAADYVRRVQSRNAFLRRDEAPPAGGDAP